MVDINFVNSINQFALDLHRKLTEKGENVFFSPLSISYALALTSLGAKGNTFEEIWQTMKLDSLPDREKIHVFYKQLKENLFDGNHESLYIIKTANCLFGDRSFEFLNSYLKNSLEFYKAELKPLNFKTDAESSRLHINEWVSNETNKKIQNLIGPGGVGETTSLVIVNAIYFKADWADKFNARDTRDVDFHMSSDETTTVPMMFMDSTCNYIDCSTLKCQVLELAFEGNHLSMLFFLPKLEQTTLKQVEASLTPSIFSALSLRKTEMKVYIPKFKTESSFVLNETLQKLGISELFSSHADLSGISQGDLSVSSVVHKAFVDVNENGCEAAAATAMILLGSSMYDPPKPVFKADHPFIFAIRDNQSKVAIFTGTLMKPLKNNV